jgi:hypothetical protein
MTAPIDPAVKAHLSRAGKLGNRKLRDLYTKKQLREWARKGGRPKKKGVDKSI